jgi:GNAT superfamily N-acetyltransferase
VADLVAVAQLAGSPEAERPELAILVEDAWQGCGLGRRLLRALLSVANDRGDAEATLSIAGQNRPMWRLVSEVAQVDRVTYEGGFAEVVVRTPQRAAR